MNLFFLFCLILWGVLLAGCCCCCCCCLRSTSPLLLGGFSTFSLQSGHWCLFASVETVQATGDAIVQHGIQQTPLGQPPSLWKVVGKCAILFWWWWWRWWRRRWWWWCSFCKWMLYSGISIPKSLPTRLSWWMCLMTITMWYQYACVSTAGWGLWIVQPANQQRSENQALLLLSFIILNLIQRIPLLNVGLVEVNQSMIQSLSKWWFQMWFIFYPTWGWWSNLTNIFQMGWNYHLVVDLL